MMRRPKRQAANGTRMSKDFLVRLDAGLLIDRTRSRGKNRKTVTLPKSLRKFIKKEAS